MTGTVSHILLVLHGTWRWLVLACAAACVGRSLRGVLERRPWSTGDRRSATIFVGVLDVQLALGLLLFIVLRAPFAFAGHVAAMIAAVALAHCGNVASKRVSPEAAPRWAATFFTPATLIVVAAIPWARPLLRLWTFAK